MFDEYDFSYDGPWEFESESEAYRTVGKFLSRQDVIRGSQYVSGGDYEAEPAEGYTIDDVLDRFEAIAGGDVPIDLSFSQIGADDQPKLYYSYEVPERYINADG